MTDVFISYSRRDIAFARLLHKALQDSDLQTWIDWQDIPPSADWLAEVYGAIERADTFVFIISPSAVRSEICEKEISHAAKNNKRLIPIVIDDIDPEVVPDPVSQPNWILFKPDEGAFQSAVKDLIDAIQIDQTWVKEHTRLLTRALEWERKDRESGYLLRGRDLYEAEAWLSGAALKDPRPTSLQTQYILASRRDATRRGRITLAAVLGGLVLSVGLGIMAWSQRNVAVSERDQRATAQVIAEEAESTAFFKAQARATEIEVRETAQAVAEEQRDIAVSRQLSSLSATYLGRNRDTALLLAIEARRAGDTHEAATALREALIYPGRTAMILRGHAGEVNHIAANQEGTLLASSSADGIARIWSIETGKLLHVLEAHTDSVLSTIWNRDASRLLSTSLDGTARVWDVETGAELFALRGHTGPVRGAAWNESGNRILTAGEDGTARIWDADSGAELIQLEHGAPLQYAEWSRDGRFALTVGGKSIRIWEVEHGKQAAIIETERFSSSYATWKGDMAQVVIPEIGNAPVWDVTGVLDPEGDISVPTRLAGHSHTVPAAEIGRLVQADWSPDGTQILTVSTDGTAEVWNSETGQGVLALSGHTDSVNQGVWSSDGARILTASSDGTARVWSAENGQEIAKLSGHRGSVNHAIWLSDGFRVATAGSDHDLHIWDIDPIKDGASHDSGVQERSRWSNDGSLIVTSGYTVSVWDSGTGAEIASIPGDDAQWSPDGEHLLVTDDSPTMQLWDLERPDNAPAALAGHTELKGHENEVLNAAWSSDGELIASVGSDRNIRLWAIASRKELAVIPVPGDAPSRVAWGGGDEWLLAQGSTSISVSSVQELPEAGPDSSPTAIIHHQGGNINHSAWNPSGGQIITAGEDGIARIWNSETGEEIMALAGHTDAVTFAAWDPTATRIVTTSNDNTSRTWDAESGEELLILAGHAGPAAHAAWDQSGALLVTTSWDTTARLWDATTGRELAVVEGCLDAVRHVSWEPHGNRFVVTSWGGPAKIPIAALADNLEQACSYAPRNLTRTEWEQLVAGETCRKTCPNLPDACS